MKFFLTFLAVFFIFGNTACSSNDHNTRHTEAKPIRDSDATLNLSIEDQTIIKKYKDTIHNLNFREREHANQVMKDSLPEISKIKNDHEREKLQMQIYLATAMYQEAHDLNGKMLKDVFSEARLLTQCELSYYAKRPQNEYEKCYAELALLLQQTLNDTPKNDPEYLYGEWGYLLAMYKAGHEEYKQKMEEFIHSTQDETMKYQFESSYELAIEQVASYK
ncbi:hypothetical protein MXL26_07395 [Acinetobacter towneri]|uniref:hypothetical protein n=1 Tax=Acinetobacter towneri TaxID=202956 RepID=UPI002DB86225|nr:hypothetical protein [Acinetobacter towneri]MEB6565186.1 hypothetical protein [Acinetobacter towneri]